MLSFQCNIQVSLTIAQSLIGNPSTTKYDGVVSFISKTQLVEHYEQTLGAKLFGGNRMFIDTKEAFILTTKYFKDFKL